MAVKALVVTRASSNISDLPPAVPRCRDQVRADTARPSRVWSARNRRSCLSRGADVVGEGFIDRVRSQLSIRGKRSDHRAAAVEDGRELKEPGGAMLNIPA